MSQAGIHGQWYIQPQPCINECVGMWVITGTIELQMSRNVADSGLCMSILTNCIALYITCVNYLTNSFC